GQRSDATTACETSRRVSSGGSLQVNSGTMTFRTGTTVLAPPQCFFRFARVLHTERERDAAAAGCENVLGGDVDLSLGELRRHARERAGLVSDTHFDRLPLGRAKPRLLSRPARPLRVLLLSRR